MKYKRPNQGLRGFTLIELLIAISLVGMIMVAIVAIDVSARRFLTSSDYEARVQNEVAPILERIVKDISLGIGQDTNPGVRVVVPGPVTGERVEIRQPDTNNPPTYSNYLDDRWIAYYYLNNAIYRETCNTVNADGSSCIGWDAASTALLAGNIIDCNFVVASDTSATTKNRNLWVNTIITARRSATQQASPENPEVRLETTAALRSQSIN